MKTTTTRRLLRSQSRVIPGSGSTPLCHLNKPGLPRLKVWAAWLLAFACGGLSLLQAANLLTNPGFESGQLGWSNRVRGGTAMVISDPALAHSGNNCISNYNAGGWSSAEQGDATSAAYGTGVSLPVSPSRYYRLSAWVKVPGATTNAQAITLRYRFEPSGNRVDVGSKTINTEAWTLLESGWVQPGPIDSYMSYWEVHSLNNGVMFFADDCGLFEAESVMLQGRVVDGSGNGVDDATVRASSSYMTVGPVVTSGGGWYFLTLPQGTYTVSATSPGYKGSLTQVVSANPTTAPDITLATDPDYDPELIFSALSTAITPGAAWPTVNPAGASLTPIGSPGVHSYGGVQWEQNNADGPGYLFGTYSSPIPVNGASIVVVAKPKRMPSNNWDSIVDVFYDRLVLGIRNDTGMINVRRNGTLDFSAAAIPDGQPTVLSLVVQPTGEYRVWANGAEVMNNAGTSDMTSLIPNVAGAFANAINVGRNNPDPWTTFNGNIGDVYLYNVAITDAKRQALESSLLSKFITNATLSYTITASAGANGSISPLGATAVVQGYDKTYTITANAGYVVSSVLVDGVSVGATTSYTFANVSANHTISATFVTLPPQTITASAGANGAISPNGPVSVPAGTDQTFLMQPGSGYAVSNVVVDGVSLGEVYSYTFPFVVAPHTISVTFRALSMNVPKADQVVFSVVADALPGNDTATGPWPTYVPANKTLSVIGTPTSTTIAGPTTTNVWESNLRSTADGYRYPGGSGAGGEYLAPIPCSGATIVAVAIPRIDFASGDAWTSLVDVFYDRLTLGVRHDTGAVFARVNGVGANSTATIPDGQPTLLTMLVQTDGSYQVWANGAPITSGTGPALTSFVPGVETFKHYINVGRNDPDGWTAFNGNIGDVFLYKTALSSADRSQLEIILAAKYGIVIPNIPFSGKVTLEDGVTPVSGALVTATGLLGTYSATSVADGTYSFLVMAGDTYDVNAAKAGFSQANANFFGTVSSATVYNFQMTPANTIRGTVRNTSGTPIGNAVVQVGDTGPATVSAPDGRYSVVIVPATGVSFYADALGYADHTETIDTSAAATGVITKDVVLTAKAETDYTYIQNGGFETGLAPWGLNYGSPIVGVTSSEHASGTKAGYWQSTVAAWYEGYLYQRVPVVEGSTYNVYFKVKTSAAIGQCGFDFLNLNGDSMAWWGYAGGGDTWMYNTVPNVWEQSLNYRNWNNTEHLTCVRVTPPAGAASIQLIMGLGADAVGQVLYVDDVVVDRVGPAAPPLAPTLSLVGGVPTFTLQSLTGHEYRLVYKNSLNDTTWGTIQGAIWTAGTGAQLTLTDSSSSLPGTRFYRVELR